MKIYIALFRGINVGGTNVLPMKDLVALLEDIGSQNVKTYIQSGNAVFQNKEENASLLSNKIRAAIKESHGFEPQVLLLTPEEMARAIEANPFPEAESEPKTLHLHFLASMPKNPDLGALESIKSDRERFALKDKVFYLHATDGIGRSKLAANTEKLLGVAITSRNWRTVCKVMTMLKQYGASNLRRFAIYSGLQCSWAPVHPCCTSQYHRKSLYRDRYLETRASVSIWPKTE
jgi:uncharacterized protein (DUF1697 family)